MDFFNRYTGTSKNGRGGRSCLGSRQYFSNGEMQQQKFRGGGGERRKKEGKKERNAKVGRVNKIEGNEYSNGWGIFVAGTYEIRRALPNDLENLNGTQFLIRFLDSQPRILFSQNEELKWKTRGIERKFGICI